MKKIRVFIGSLNLVLIFVAVSFAQTETPPLFDSGKIAVINTEAFYERGSGIEEIVEANDKLDAEFKLRKDELSALAEKLQKREKQIKSYESSACYPSEALGKMTAELEKLLTEFDESTSEYKQKRDATKSLYEKRKTEIFANVDKKIEDALKQFSREKNFALILDISKLNDGMLFGELDDITKEFIKYYNENFAASGSQ